MLEQRFAKPGLRNEQRVGRQQHIGRGGQQHEQRQHVDRRVQLERVWLERHWVERHRVERVGEHELGRVDFGVDDVRRIEQRRNRRRWAATGGRLDEPAAVSERALLRTGGSDRAPSR
jgi:hypothetical protein